ncbi:ABC exporter membrane fusion protein [Calothrix rhizosoleniae]|uniref:ABC exporter membrane fusion protein n=1 Tax=Calothrix rhizosoleniae TaxID=888997 RepID=UPI000B49EC75|nr:ABC exporter membrane fusion protein [Calothrix rhizosoleniae]
MAVDRERQLFPPSIRWRIILGTSIAVILGLVSFYSYFKLRSNFATQAIKSSQQSQSPKNQSAKRARVAVTALGHLVPEGEVTQLSAPSSLSGIRVEKLLIKQGDKVKAGQVVAWLQGYSKATAAWQQAKDKLKVSEAKLSQIEAGAKKGDINAQEATISRLNQQLVGEIATQKAAIARLKAQVENADTENQRYQKLYQEGAISASNSDSKRLQLKTVQQQLKEAQANLNSTRNSIKDQLKEAKAKLTSIREVRTVDVNLAKAELKSAMTGVTQAKAERDLTYVIAPIDGTILKVHAKTGEVVATSGIVEIGKTSQMYVIAEVYQTDIENVRIGQKATISSTAFSGKLQGTVSDIGLLVDRQSILSINPGADTDRRIIQVKIRINNPEDSKKVASLTHLQVDVAIKI